MSDNKKYYYLKLKDNFYDSEEMIILQNMSDGYLYSDILMKLYLRSLKNGGKLMFNDLIPYTPEVLAQVVRHQVGTVEKALKIFKQLNLIEVLDNGAIYMLDIQNFIGESSTEADRIRDYRAKIKKDVQMLQQTNNKSTPEIDIEIDIEKDIELKKKKDIKSKKSKPKEEYKKYGEFENVFFTDVQYEKLKQIFPKDYMERIQKLDDYMQSSGKKYKDCLATLRNWARKEGYKFPNQNTNEYKEIQMTEEEYYKLNGGKKRYV